MTHIVCQRISAYKVYPVGYITKEVHIQRKKAWCATYPTQVFFEKGVPAANNSRMCECICCGHKAFARIQVYQKQAQHLSLTRTVHM